MVSQVIWSKRSMILMQSTKKFSNNNNYIYQNSKYFLLYISWIVLNINRKWYTTISLNQPWPDIPKIWDIHWGHLKILSHKCWNLNFSLKDIFWQAMLKLHICICCNFYSYMKSSSVVYVCQILLTLWYNKNVTCFQKKILVGILNWWHDNFSSPMQN